LRGGAARRSLELLEETGVLEVLIPRLDQRLKADAAVRARLYGVLDGVDGAVRAGEAPSNALLLCALLAPLTEDLLYEPDAEPFKGDLALELDERARPILESMRASRRDTERARQILLVQRRLGPSKKRRNRPMTLVRRDWFAEALAIYELMHRGAEGETAEEIARWHRMLRDSHSAPHAHAHGEHGEHERPAHESEAAAGGDGGNEPRKRRRRRRGGRRRRRGQGGGAGGGEAPVSGDGFAAKSEQA
jgi:hypothetical protein